MRLLVYRAENWSCTMGQSTEFDFLLWTIAQKLIMRYEPECRIWFCDLGNSAEYFYAHNVVMRYGPWCRNIYTSVEILLHSLKGK
jgi:hypothetical protein